MVFQSVNSMRVLMLCSLGAMAVFIALLAWPEGLTGVGRPAARLVVYCGAGVRVPVDAALRQYELEYGVSARLQYGGSASLLAGIEVSRSGDLYIPGDDYYIDLACAKGLVRCAVPLAVMRPVAAVRKGNPAGVRVFSDLLRPDVRLSLASADATAVGRLIREHLREGGRWDALQARAAVVKNTVSDVAADVRTGAADVAIVWDVTIHQMPELQAVELPELAPLRARVSAAVLKSATDTAEAVRFARFLAASDKGAPLLAAAGFTVERGDPWAYRPEIVLLADENAARGVEAIVTAFESMEGAKVTRVYQNGALIGYVRRGQIPDVCVLSEPVPAEAAAFFPETERISAGLAGDSPAATRATGLFAAVSSHTRYPNMCRRLLAAMQRALTDAHAVPYSGSQESGK